ncbi:MAG: hypothetical protein HY364_02405 [Candidatus Aenigmarchaeota archaeon]|nr:hypothetical protein [Candidatus Aenigmarchaeota archaeon]
MSLSAEGRLNLFKTLMMFLFFISFSHAELSCTVVNTGSCSGTVVAGISDTSNAHADSSGSYPKVLCCTEQYSGTLGTSCAIDHERNVTLFKLSASTNAHAELNNQTNYNTNVCLSYTGNISMGYASSCDAYDTCVASISGNTNGHVGNCDAYATKICATTKNLTLRVTQGQGALAASASYAPINITVNFYDEGMRIFPSGVSGIIWVEKSPGVWDDGHACTTDANGNCSVSFLPDCTYSGGMRNVRGGPWADSFYRDKNSSSVNITLDIEARCADTITFSIEANLNGNGGDTVSVDGRGAGFYNPPGLSRRYACIQDTSIAGSPVLAMIYAGDALKYINVTSGSSFVLKMSQFQTGNKFILGVTDGGCGRISDRSPDIESGSLAAISDFIATAANNIQIALSYPGIDIVGEFSKAGTFTVTLQKNQTNVTQIIARD